MRNLLQGRDRFWLIVVVLGGCVAPNEAVQGGQDGPVADLAIVADLATLPASEDLTALLPSEDLGTALPSEDLATLLSSEDLATMLPSEDLASMLPSDDLASMAATEDLTSSPPSSDLTSTADLKPIPDLLPSACGAQTLCGVACVDTKQDEANCGGCGNLCSVGATCTDGVCGCTGNGCKALPGVWQKLAATGLPVMRVRALAVNASGHLFAAGFSGVWKSTDGGSTFTKVGLPNTTNDPPYTTIQTMGLTSLGEPIVGLATPGATGTTAVMVARYATATNSWVTATVTQQMNLGGYFPIAFRTDVDGNLLSSWPFRNDIQRSTDDGSSWTSFAPIPNASHTPPAGPSATVKAVYGVAIHPQSGEIFCGTEGDQWWRSFDRGASWSMVDAAATSSIGTEPGQNGFLIAFNKDGEALIGTQGKPAGDFLMREKSDGTMVTSNGGFGAWAMVNTANAYGVLREMPLTSEGHNFLAMPINDNMGGSLPADLYGSIDGATWEAIVAPFVPELNAVIADGATVLVGGGASSPGTIWRFSPTIKNHLPRVSTGFAKGVAATCPLTGLALTGSATDADGDPLTYSWKARGPGVVTFVNATAAATTASFSVNGDYVLTLHASDGKRAAGAPLIVHVTD